MTTTPTAGDIWEWLGDDPAVIFIIGQETSLIDNCWQGLNLTTHEIEDISFHEHNIHNWRLLS